MEMIFGLVDGKDYKFKYTYTIGNLEVLLFLSIYCIFY